MVFKAPQKSGFALAGVLLGAKTNSITGALTVAGQWRNFTAFPSILTIAIVDYAASRSSRNDDAMNAISMTSTFINGLGCEVKRRPFERRKRPQSGSPSQLSSGHWRRSIAPAARQEASDQEVPSFRSVTLAEITRRPHVPREEVAVNLRFQSGRNKNPRRLLPRPATSKEPDTSPRLLML